MMHVQSVIQAFALHSYILLYQMILLADSKGPDRTAWPIKTSANIWWTVTSKQYALLHIMVRTCPEGISLLIGAQGNIR